MARKSTKRSEAMRRSWERRKAAKVNDTTLPVGEFLEASAAAIRLVESVGGDEGVAKTLVDHALRARKGGR